jgi:hypothetical protein
MAGGAHYLLGRILEGAPVKTEDGRTVGHVEDGLMVVTDPDAIAPLKAGTPVTLSIGTVEPPEDWIYAGQAERP